MAPLDRREGREVAEGLLLRVRQREDHIEAARAARAAAQAQAAKADEQRFEVVLDDFIDLYGPPPLASRDRWLNDDEARLLWRALKAARGLFKLLLLTGQRREEVAGMRWSEFDLDRAEWVIPNERGKNKAGHAVDLALAASRPLGA